MPTTHFDSVEDYFASLPASAKRALETIRRIFLEVAPDAAPSISYNMPAYRLGEVPYVHMAAFTRHVSLFPRSTAMETRFGDELLPYSSGRGTLQFPLDQSLPEDLLRRLAVFMKEAAETKRAS